MVEGTRLLIWRTGNGTEGSNPSLSASNLLGFSGLARPVNSVLPGNRKQMSRSIHDILPDPEAMLALEPEEQEPHPRNGAPGPVQDRWL